MKILYVFLVALIAMSCASTRYVYVVRHAEKLDKTPYSVLSPSGHARAARLRDSLMDKNIGVVFATTFQRTQETAQPLATAINKPLLIYRNNAVDSIVNVINQLPRQNILLVGHSGNIPDIISGLTGVKVKSIGEEEYGNLYIIREKGKTKKLVEAKY
jgi:phosphohistidine phosphatase SixA